MLAAAGKPSAAENSPSRPLPLENGEFMHSSEFLRRYERMPQLKKAELIEGVVYMGSPVSVRHAKPDGIIQVWLGTYASRHPDTEALPNATVILDAENTVQPDALLRRLPEHGGLTRPSSWVVSRVAWRNRRHHPMAMRDRNTAVVQRDGKWFIAFCPEVPEANGQGKTREECLQSLAAAIELVLDYRREQGLEKAPRGAEQTSILV